MSQSLMEVNTNTVTTTCEKTPKQYDLTNYDLTNYLKQPSSASYITGRFKCLQVLKCLVTLKTNCAKTTKDV